MRRGIWDSGHQCPIIGTCLTLKELRKIAGRFPAVCDAGAAAYVLHGEMVGICQSKNELSKFVTRFLDKKYCADIARVSALKAGELGTFWDECVREGRIAGAFWAVLSRDDVPHELEQRVFGEVHMMSHLQGAEQRVSLSTLAAARRSIERLEQERRKLIAKNIELREAKKTLERDCDEMRARVVLLSSQKTALKEMVASYESGGEAEAARQIIDKMKNENLSLRKQMNYLEAKSHMQDSEITLLRDRVESQATLIGHLKKNDNNAMAAHVHDECKCGDGRCDTCECAVDRRQVKVLYVGGVEKLCPHYREVAELIGAEFHRHDGMERSGRLGALIESADVVICPVDCNSHQACLRVKNECKKADKPYEMLRSSSISAFSRAVTKYCKPA